MVLILWVLKILTSLCSVINIDFSMLMKTWTFNDVIQILSGLRKGKRKFIIGMPKKIFSVTK